MNSQEFLRAASETARAIVAYKESLASQPVTPNVEPGYMRDLVASDPPSEPENYHTVLSEALETVLPGMAHWQHPRFHAYFPAGASYPSLLGGLLGDGLGAIGFSWASCPAMTELEAVVMDMLAKMFGLPEHFRFGGRDSQGGGALQACASECTLDALLAARSDALQKLQESGAPGSEHEHLSRLIAYCSAEAHSSVEKAAMIAFVRLRVLEPNEDGDITGDSLHTAATEDISRGFVPFFACATIGTTGSTAFDRISEIGPVASELGLWLHIDGAYGGNLMVCPEFRPLMAGVEHADSFAVNLNKMLLVNFDASCFFVRDRKKLARAMAVDPLYLKHENEGEAIDYRHWGIPLSRRFRALKIWFTIRCYGVAGLQKVVRDHCAFARRFQQLVQADGRFVVCAPVRAGLVCFRLAGDDDKETLTRQLLTDLNASHELHMVPAYVGGKYAIRFCVCDPDAVMSDVDDSWNIVVKYTNKLLGVSVDEEIEEEEGAAVPTPKKAEPSYFVRCASDANSCGHQVLPLEKLVSMQRVPEGFVACYEAKDGQVQCQMLSNEDVKGMEVGWRRRHEEEATSKPSTSKSEPEADNTKDNKNKSWISWTVERMLNAIKKSEEHEEPSKKRAKEDENSD